LNYEPLPGIRAALEMYVSLVQRSHWAVAIGTGLVFEGGGPKRMKEEREALEKYYPWIPEACLDFFRAHEYHDEGHGNMVIDVKAARGNARSGTTTSGHYVAAERLHLQRLRQAAVAGGNHPRDRRADGMIFAVQRSRFKVQGIKLKYLYE
jgi:hypothetical protein